MSFLTTARLMVRRATAHDVDLYLQLWAHPAVMQYVGFPQGMPVSRDQILAKIPQDSTGSLFDCLLVATLKSSGDSIGECKMARPDEDGISITDIKLLPDHWRQGYGKELKKALVNYLFTHTDCVAVQATPNKENIASIKMQEAVGGMRVGEGMTEFPESMKVYSPRPVHYYIYRVYRPGYKPPEA
jgi:RimJ/RimL family protein N-acetyltransferase